MFFFEIMCRTSLNDRSFDDIETLSANHGVISLILRVIFVTAWLLAGRIRLS